MVRGSAQHRTGWRRTVTAVAAAVIVLANTVAVIGANGGGKPDGETILICTADGVVARTLTPEPTTENRSDRQAPVRRFFACALCVVAAQSAGTLPQIGADLSKRRTEIDRRTTFLTEVARSNRPGLRPCRPRDPPSLR